MNDELERLLAEKQVIPTAMRLRVLDFLLQQEHAVSIAEIEKGLVQSDRITLYRTLKVFEDKCLVHTINDGSGGSKYALCDDHCLPGNQHQDMHIHFTCHECGATFCLPETTIPEIQLPAGFLSAEISMHVKGTCAACARKNATSLQAVVE